MSNFSTDPYDSDPNQPPRPVGDHEPAQQGTLYELLDAVELRVTADCPPIEQDGVEVCSGRYLIDDSVVELSWSRSLTPANDVENATMEQILLNAAFSEGTEATIVKSEPADGGQYVETTYSLVSVGQRITPFRAFNTVNIAEEAALLQRLKAIPADIRESMARDFLARSAQENQQDNDEVDALERQAEADIIKEKEARDLAAEIRTAVFLGA